MDSAAVSQGGRQKGFLGQLVALTHSVKLAVFVIVALAIALAVGTILESAYDTATAKYYVYQSVWFRGILCLLAINLIGVMVNRWPWKPRHTPFLLAHIGILTLLLGSWITDRFGVDGNLRVNEGETGSVVELDSPSLAIADRKDFEIVPIRWRPPTAEFKPFVASRGAVAGAPLTVDAYIAHADPVIKFLPAESPTTPGAAPAIKLRLTGGPMRITQDYWLWTGSPGWSGVQAGPAWLSFGSENPGPGEIHPGGPNLLLNMGADGSLSYKAYASTGGLVQGRVPLAEAKGKTIDPQWKGVSLTIADWIPHATLMATYKPSRTQWGEMAPPSAIHVTMGEAPESQAWLGLGDRATIRAGGRELSVEYFRRRVVLPFGVRLDRFTIDRYQGSMSPAEYSSRVTVLDGRNIVGAQEISMNQPLQRGGFTLYQASYEEAMPRPTVSIFSVNHDPGRPWKYVGSLTIVLGTILLFAMKYWKRPRSSAASEEEVAS